MENRTAEIIAFPAPSGPPLDRLARALAKLEAALAEQGAAVRQWRGGLGELSETMSSMDRSVHDLQTSIDTLAARNAAARDQALRLHAWADDVLSV